MLAWASVLSPEPSARQTCETSARQSQSQHAGLVRSIGARLPVCRAKRLGVRWAGATGLEPATSGVTGRYGTTGYDRL
jgi:hypothetical protein